MFNPTITLLETHEPSELEIANGPSRECPFVKANICIAVDEASVF